MSPRLRPDPPVLRLTAALEPVECRTLAARDRLHLFEGGGDRTAAEESLAGAEHHREDEQPEFIDQVVLQQRLQRVGAAPGVQGAAGLLPELPDSGDGVAPDQAGVVPGDLLQAARQHVLGPRVERCGNGIIGVGDPGPEVGEDIVGLAPQQEAVGIRESSDDQFPDGSFGIGGLPASMREAPSGSSSGAPGACMTPSRVRNAFTTILGMCPYSYAAAEGLE